MTNEQLQQIREELERNIKRHDDLAAAAELGESLEDAMSCEYHVGRASAFKMALLMLDVPH